MCKWFPKCNASRKLGIYRDRPIFICPNIHAIPAASIFSLQASSPHIWNLIELEFLHFEQCNETLWDVGIRKKVKHVWSELNITAVWSSEGIHNRHKTNSRMKDMKGYLSGRLILRHIGWDEKQKKNVHGILKKCVALWPRFYWS